MTAPLIFVTAADVATVAFDDYLESLGVPGGADEPYVDEDDFYSPDDEARWDNHHEAMAGRP